MFAIAFINDFYKRERGYYYFGNVKQVAWIGTIFLSIILNSRILARSVGSVSTVACTSSPMEGWLTQMRMEHTTYSVKVSRTSISRDCVRGFWTAL